GGVVGDRQLPRVRRLGHGGRGAIGCLHHGVRRAPGAGEPDPLDEALRQHPSLFDVAQFVLERRRSRVDDEDETHADAPCCGAAAPCAWIAVIATVLTMSSTSAPRERSLMGLFRPCSTGPIATAPAERCTAL